ncbi:MAG: hypothetical protein JWR16_2543 [Nevskia sp.]|nr:hypothetical protein [Nevskia sp.]
MRAFYAVAVLAAAVVSGTCIADDLSAAKAEELLQPVMPKDCGSYYTSQGEPDFADIEDKTFCTYKPRVTRIVMGTNSATAEYNRDRHFDNDLSVAWLKDYAKMQSHTTPSLLFQKLKSNLDKWRADGAVDRAPRPGKATFKLDAGGWQVDSAPQ